MLRSSLLLALALLAAGCDTPLAKYAACETDADCKVQDGGKAVCWSLRCVECHYDTDCEAGKICGGGNTCESLDTRTPEQPIEPAKTLEECAKRCKGRPGCGEGCRDAFKGVK